MGHSQVLHPFQNLAATTLNRQDNPNPSAEVIPLATAARLVGLDWRE
jgi:hypothetical protein